MKLSRLRWLALASAVVAVAVACSRGSDPSFPKRSSLLDTEASRLGFKSPATWRFHPRTSSALLARAELGQGSYLYAGEQGERWIYDKKSNSVSAAARLAPENIVAILKIEGGAWLFVGESGTGYEAKEPLGGFVRASVPLDKLARVSAATSAVVGVTRNAELVRSADAGATWKNVGTQDVRFVDVALMEGGKGVALSVPEAMWETKDDGASWKKLDVAPTGALGLAWDDVAGITVDTALGFKKWSPNAPTQLPALGRAPKKGRFSLGQKPARGPDAAALAEGRALVQGGEYIEAAAKSSGSGDNWSLWRGPIGGRLKERDFLAAKGCKAVRLAAFDKWMYFACSIRNVGANQEFKVFRSQNRGKLFEEEDYVVEGRLGSLFLAVGAEGALSVTGICSPHDSTRGCSPYGIFHRRIAPVDAGVDGKADKKDKDKKDTGDAGTEKKDGPEYELAPAATPALKGSALALAFTPDGKTTFAVGRRTKGTSFAVFVSHDGGRSFEGRDLDQLEPDYDPPESDDRYGYARPPPAPPAANVSTVSVGEDGTLAIVLDSYPPTLVVVDEDGRVIALSRAPSSATAVGAVGTRALAISANDFSAWESLDGGGTWTSIGRLPSGTRARSSGDKVMCHQGGCIVGAELSRIGWRGQGDDDQGVLTSNDASGGDLYDRSVRTPISCATDEKAWTAMPKVPQPPGADRAMLGKAVWYVMTQDDTKASVALYQATGGNRAKVENVALLAPVPKPQTVAYAAQLQVEGAAAIRYAVADTTTNLKNVEVVWSNLFESRVYKARVVDAGPSTPSDFVRTGWAANRAQPALMSISTGGIYLRPHGGSRDNQTTLFLDGRSVVSIPANSWSSAKGGSSDMVHVGGVHVPISYLPNGSAILRARRDGASWVEEAYATGLADVWRFGLTQDSDLTYAPGGRPAMWVETHEADGTRHSSLLFPFRATGAVVDPPIATPMQRDTGDKPNKCGNTHRNDTPRVVSPYQGGTRHPIVVSDPVEPLRLLLTNRAVMHGTPQDPCVAAFDAEVIQLDPGIGTPEQERAILPLDDLEHSWIFRTIYDPNGEATVEYRMMSCRFDGGVEIPPEVYAATGTRVKRAH